MIDRSFTMGSIRLVIHHSPSQRNEQRYPSDAYRHQNEAAQLFDAGRALKAVKGTAYSEPKFFRSHETSFPHSSGTRGLGVKRHAVGGGGFASHQRQDSARFTPASRERESTASSKGGEVP